MTVNELIAALQALPTDQRDFTVFFDDDEYGPLNVKGLYVNTDDKTVELLDYD